SKGLPFSDAVTGVSESGSRALFAGIFLVIGVVCTYLMLNKVIDKVQALVEFSERWGAGDYRAKLDADTNDDFGLIAENLNRTADKVNRSVNNQEAQDTLQKSVTEFLTITSQIARGDLTLRGKVTNDALGNVVDSVNYMLDNFAKVLERVRKAAIDVS